MKIAVMSCPAHQDRLKSVIETWWRAELCRVFYADGFEESRENLGKKYRMTCRELRREDYVFFCDTDTYVNVPRLLHSGFQCHRFIGHARTDWMPVYPFGGAGFWLSHEALNMVADADWDEHTKPGFGFAADLTIGSILAERIPLYDDRRYALYESPMPSNNIITEHLSGGRYGPYRPEMMYEAHERAVS